MGKGKTFYDFQFNTRLVKSTIVHFQVETVPISLTFSIVLMKLVYHDSGGEHVLLFPFLLCFENMIFHG